MRLIEILGFFDNSWIFGFFLMFFLHFFGAGSGLSLLVTIIWQPGKAMGDSCGDDLAPRAKGGVTEE